MSITVYALYKMHNPLFYPNLPQAHHRTLEVTQLNAFSSVVASIDGIYFTPSFVPFFTTAMVSLQRYSIPLLPTDCRISTMMPEGPCDA